MSPHSACLKPTASKYRASEALCPRASADLVLSVDDDLDDTPASFGKSATLFKHGSGVGADWSTLRSTKEKLTGGGTPSGPVSCMKVQDATGGTIKSGGPPLRRSPTSPASRRDAIVSGCQLVWTLMGPKTAAVLASETKPFGVLVYDEGLGRYALRRALVVQVSRGDLVRVTTDKGTFSVSPGLVFRLSPSGRIPARDLKRGRRLFGCSVDESGGYPRLHLRDGKKGKRPVHRVVAEDLLGADVAGRVVHHVDGDKMNPRPENLLVMAGQSEHAHLHGVALAKTGEHVFQKRRFPKHGESNPMHRGAEFWTCPKRSADYREKKRAEMVDRDPVALQAASIRRQALDSGHRVRDAGHDVKTMEEYLPAHELVIGRIGSKPNKRASLIRLFGSFEGFLAELDLENHKVAGVSEPWEGDRYAVVVLKTEGDAPERAPIVLWPEGQTSMTGTGAAVQGL